MTENGGFGEGSGIFFAFLIFALFAFGGGAWSGWGRNGFNGAGAVAADIGIQSQLDNIQAQNFYNSLNNGIAGIQSALCQGFAGINQTVNNTAAVAAMQNKDGSSGQYWTLKDAEEVSKAMSIDWTQKRYNIYDLYYVLNMERSDYYKADEAPQYYVERALDFLNDKDAPEGKAKRYYVAMHCMD